jgi:hypothetical protein
MTTDLKYGALHVGSSACLSTDFCLLKTRLLPLGDPKPPTSELADLGQYSDRDSISAVVTSIYFSALSAPDQSSVFLEGPSFKTYDDKLLRVSESPISFAKDM